MKHPRKKISHQKISLIRKFQERAGQRYVLPGQTEDDPLTKQTPPEASTHDFKHTLPTQGTLHRRHK